MKKNPYILQFGREPKNVISRASQIAQIVDDFTDDDPMQQVYMITGVRGAGKTVLMTEVSDYFEKLEDWIVVELNPRSSLLEELGAKLCGENALATIFQRARINLSFFGFGLEVDQTAPITNIEQAVEKMLESLKKHKKKVLVNIDEVTNTNEMAVFAGAFQIYIRKKLPIFLVMTGLYESIDALQNEENLTFLYRAPKINLKGLSIGNIADNYAHNFKLSREDALDMAKLTRGYPFAFQALGYLTWLKDGNYKDTIMDYRQILEDRSYEKLWSELSAKDKKIAYGIAHSEDGKTKDIIEFLELKPNELNQYRKRLIKKGLVNGDTHGILKFALPLFEDFILDNYEL